MRYILQFCYDKGTDAAHIHKKICAVNGQDKLLGDTALRWFCRFSAENFDVKYALRSGRLSTEKVVGIIT